MTPDEIIYTMNDTAERRGGRKPANTSYKKLSPVLWFLPGVVNILTRQAYRKQLAQRV